MDVQATTVRVNNFVDLFEIEFYVKATFLLFLNEKWII